ncbi:MAG: hypothetical protein E7616_04925 [Ruminococcaceae bacterium]|nr:hypothetical protein [Oscillospiraceae bacterium]
MNRRKIQWAILLAIIVLMATITAGFLIYMSFDDKNDRPDELIDNCVPYPDDESILDIVSQGTGYDGTLRVGKNGELLFSPYLDELRDRVSMGDDLENYSVQLTFVLMEKAGIPYWAYPSVTLPISASEDKWYDVLLQGEGEDCGFCPTGDRLYNIEVTILKNDKPQMVGVWRNIQAPKAYTKSEYYTPTPIPTDADRKQVQFTVKYFTTEGGYLKGDVEQILHIGSKTASVTAVPKDGYLFACWSDGVTDATRKGEVFVRDETIYARFTKVELDPGIANMFIVTETGKPITSKTQYVNATITIEGAANDKYNTTLTTQIRGRGNSSFSSTALTTQYNSKNSYRLKLTEKTNLLGVGGSSNRDWVLQSNKFDVTNLRNYFVWNLAKQMQTIPFVPGCTWVNLYINGDYRGIYMITDQIEVANDRVEVDDSGSDPDKGYLVEFDTRGQSEIGAVEGLTYFYIPGFYDTDINLPREWVIKSNVTSKAENSFIRDYFIKCHKAIMNGKRNEIDKLVDIPSLVDMFIIEELTKDVDVGAASNFWQKEKGGKLYFTAPWDFDTSLGAYGVAVYIDGFVCEYDKGEYHPHLWLNSLIQQKWFLTELYARMQQVSDMIETAKSGVIANAAMLRAASDRNDARWHIYGREYHPFVSQKVSVQLKDYDAQIDYMCNWIDERFEWMMQEIWSRLFS